MDGETRLLGQTNGLRESVRLGEEKEKRHR